MLERHGHRVVFVKDYILPGAPDPLVATVSQELKAILISFDGDFRKIAPRIPIGQRRRFRHLSRIWMRCTEPQAAPRLEAALPFIEAEYALAEKSADARMILQIGKSYLRTDR